MAEALASDRLEVQGLRADKGEMLLSSRMKKIFFGWLKKVVRKAFYLYSSALRLRNDVSVQKGGKRIVVFSFSGAPAGRLVPSFEFRNFLEKYSVTKVFVRDMRVCWYQRGLVGVSEDVDGSVDYLKKLIQEINPDKTVFIGASMGGYASILFGTLLDADVVLSFSPKTLFEKDERHFDERYADLKKLITSSKSKTEYHIFYGGDRRDDVFQSERLTENPRITLHKYAGDHKLVKNLRDSGELKIILDEYLQ